jgi:hypothetical protein
MSLAILGRGSLVWDAGDLQIIDGAWHRAVPTLVLGEA